MRVLFADSVVGVDHHRARGARPHLRRRAQAQGGGSGGSVGGYDALVVRSTKVGRGVFEAADRLALVIRAGAGTNTIDTGAAAARGVLVANLPGRNAAAVAELTMGLLLAVDRRIVDGTVDLRAGRWEKKKYGEARGLLGSTMGILGLGSIGLEVAERARAFGIDVRALAKPDRSADIEERAADLRIDMADSLPELLSSCDIVSLHLPSGADTSGLVDEAFLGHMRRGSILLNTSRGDIVDEDALLKALDDERRSEPGWTSSPTSPARARRSGRRRSRSTRGWSAPTTSARRPSRPSARSPRASWRSSTPSSRARCATASTSRRAGIGSVTLTVRHLDRIGVLARVLDRLSHARLNVEHMENRVFRGGDAALATIDVAGSVSSDLLAELGALPDVLGVSATTIDGIRMTECHPPGPSPAWSGRSGPIAQ